MKAIPIKNGLFAILIAEALVISAVAIAFTANLYRTYTNLIYNESAEVLNLYTIITDAKMNEIENLSFEILSNGDIQGNLRKYNDSPASYDAYKATNDLYTQLFTRWIMNKSIVSISFVFLDGKRVDAGRLHQANLSGAGLRMMLEAAARADGSCGWAANAAGENMVTLYRLIKDTSGNNKFRPLGTLLIHVNGAYFLNHATDRAKRPRPNIICYADGQILSQKPLDIVPDALRKYINDSRDYHIISFDRVPSIVSTKKLDHNGWNLVYILPTRELLRSISSINLIYIIIFLIIVTIITIIGYNFANAIGKPIARLAGAMKVVEESDYSAVLNDPLPEPRLAVTEVVQLSQDFTSMVQRIDHLINEVYLKQLLITEMKYKMLQQQVNPHFLYNTLDTINWKAVQGGNEEISIMVKSLSKLLRGSIKGPDIITVGEDLRFAADYIKIQKIRFEERLDYETHVPAALFSCRIPRLTLQPIVENCIIHNLEKYKGKCRITIAAHLADGRLEIQVEDDGRGVDLRHVEMVLNGEVETTKNSIGLKNIDERIKMAFGDKFGIRVENREPNGTRVYVILPSEEELDADDTNRR